MQAAAIIPARYPSKRFPGKSLERATGQYLIQHVYEQVKKAESVGELLIATDDDRIREAAQEFGASVVMTRNDHPSGTDRVAEAAEHVQSDIILNIQGDEPEIDPSDIDRLVALMDDSAVEMATLAAPATPGEHSDPNVVKVVTDGDGFALYFSRAPIPYVRNSGHSGSRKHVGVYAFRRSALQRFVSLEATELEITEGLEQLRALENGIRIRVGKALNPGAGIDTPEEYAAFVERYKTVQVEK